MDSAGFHIEAEAVQKAGAYFAEEETAFIPLVSFESGVYAWMQRGQRYVLKLTSRQRRTEAEILGEIDFVRFAAEQGIPVAGAVLSRHGRYVEAVGDEGPEGYWAYAFEWAEGEEIKAQDWGPELYRIWGRTTGELHRVTCLYRPSSPEWTRCRWDEEELYLAGLSAISEIPDVQMAAEPVLRRLRQAPEHAQQFGLIHHDLHHRNFHLHQGKLVVFDFDGLVHHHFASDIAIALYYALAWHSSEKDKTLFAERFLQHFLEGYAEARTVSGELLQGLPDWMLLRHMLLYASHLRNWEGSSLNTMQRWTLNRYRTDLAKGTLFGGIDFGRLGFQSQEGGLQRQ
ncbi:phosphotransferase enzyme family protein [Paenibacillus sp. y28]|uniref:phosphotransferase enzyme family protein n=1 Tax=Paenibacillus sp. y28 TaxID=3129110 RepID=UPI0030179CA8